MISRRTTLGLIGGGMLASAARIAFAAPETDKRLVVVLLRGAMDGLSAVPAIGDPDYERARNGLAQDGALPLDSTFGLHPNLTGFKELYDAKELIVVHAAATPYRDRSHFDGQNLLENGSEKPYGLDTGWLNRALAGMPAGGKPLGVALNSHMPLMMRGPSEVTSWAPSSLPPPDGDTVQRLAALYGETDPKLAQSFTDAQGANGMAMGQGNGSGGGGGGYQAFVGLMSAAAKFLSAPDGARVAMVELGGWDSHVNQAGAFSPLSTNLKTLDRGLVALKTGLGPLWKETSVIVVSEFGRTVAMNGTMGTDHGTGSAVFVAGGAVQGGRVIADWPGLSPGALYQDRDLKPTTDFRTVATGMLRDHMGLHDAALAAVFPSSSPIKPRDGLIRA
jgi:uncharacterized protein (DUF1501 family)